MSDVQKLSDIATDTKEELKGFKVLGVFPFYLNYIRTKTQIKLCGIKDKIQEFKGNSEPDINDFYDFELRSKTESLLNEYITVALINSRFFGFILKPILKLKVKECSHRQKFLLYSKILELSDPSFFLGYWKNLLIKDHTILKEEKQS